MQADPPDDYLDDDAATTGGDVAGVGIYSDDYELLTVNTNRTHWAGMSLTGREYLDWLAKQHFYRTHPQSILGIFIPAATGPGETARLPIMLKGPAPLCLQEALNPSPPLSALVAATEYQPMERSEVHLGFRFNPVTSAQFNVGQYDLRWIIKRLWVEGMPGVIGGPSKALKTSLSVDLALSIASGRPFLGTFEVNKPLRTMLLSGESGEFTLRETARRVCTSKGIQLADADSLWQFTLPQLGNRVDVANLTDGLHRRGVKVVVVDPIYLCLLAGMGTGRPSANDLLGTGPIYAEFSRACRSVGATPIYIHHTIKSSGRRGAAGEALDLNDLAAAGVAEFVRQWLLVWRRTEF